MTVQHWWQLLVLILSLGSIITWYYFVTSFTCFRFVASFHIKLSTQKDMQLPSLSLQFILQAKKYDQVDYFSRQMHVFTHVSLNYSCIQKDCNSRKHSWRGRSLIFIFDLLTVPQCDICSKGVSHGPWKPSEILPPSIPLQNFLSSQHERPSA
jgi:hypothetical protein